MKTLGLVLALVLVVGGACVADTVTLDLFAQWNFISAPLVPFNPDPLSVFSGLTVSGYLNRWDAPTQSMATYDEIDPAAFGNVLLGDGYQLYQDAAGSFTYAGVPDGVPDGGGNMTDMWISLPGYQLDGVDEGGWHLIGQPFNHDTSGVENLFLTDGTTLKTWEQAVDANWCDDGMQYWDGASQSMLLMSFGLADDDHIRAGKAYWFHTKKDNLALIIPATPS
jgi:hypothetical protein